MNTTLSDKHKSNHLIKCGQLNDEIWITESCQWIAPYSSVYDVLLISGGQGALAYSTILYAGMSGTYRSGCVYLEKDEEVAITIGTGGLSYIGTDATPNRNGGLTSFGTYLSTSTDIGAACRFPGETKPVDNYIGGMVAHGGGFGATFGHYTGINGAHNSSQKGRYYGAGGGCSRGGDILSAGDGYQGAIRLRFHNPDK